MRQSSRRSWRINQQAPRIEVYFSYYEGTMQNRAIRLMASKLAVAGIIEGNFTDEGLAAMSDCQDMTTALARELTMGIKEEVEDLGAVFKKMAILKPAAVESSHPVIAVVPAPALELIPAQSAEENEISLLASGLLSLVYKAKPAGKSKKKAVIICEGQISLFDFAEAATA